MIGDPLACPHWTADYDPDATATQLHRTCYTATDQRTDDRAGDLLGYARAEYDTKGKVMQC